MRNPDLQLAVSLGTRCLGRRPRVVRSLCGRSHAVFLLEYPEGQRVLKLARGTDATSLRRELLAAALGSRAIPVPQVEQVDLDGRMCGRPFLLFTSAGSLNLGQAAVRWPKRAPELFREMGRLQARLHFMTTTPTQEAGQLLTADFHQKVERIYQLARTFQAAGQLPPAAVETFLNLPLPRLDGVQLCHGDFHPVQCLVADGQLAAVGDWESAWVGDARVDLAITQAYLEFAWPGELTDCFFAGYTEQQPLPVGYQRDYRVVRLAQTLALAHICVTGGPRQRGRQALALFQQWLAEL